MSKEVCVRQATKNAIVSFQQERTTFMDTIDSIIEAVLIGKSLHITVSGLRDEAFVAWRSWLRGFNMSCGVGYRCVNCNSVISVAGNERLEIGIGAIPGGQRKQFVDELRSICSKDPPKIALK